jgi:hypothetical protein
MADAYHATQDDAKRREVSALSASGDVVECALARALDRASGAGRFDVVAQLASELEARRLARAGTRHCNRHDRYALVTSERGAPWADWG